jgi:hypothetical protein
LVGACAHFIDSRKTPQEKLSACVVLTDGCFIASRPNQNKRRSVLRHLSTYFAQLLLIYPFNQCISSQPKQTTQVNPVAEWTVYGSMKAGLERMVQGLCTELAPCVANIHCAQNFHCYHGISCAHNIHYAHNIQPWLLLRSCELCRFCISHCCQLGSCTIPPISAFHLLQLTITRSLSRVAQQRSARPQTPKQQHLLCLTTPQNMVWNEDFSSCHQNERCCASTGLSKVV